MLNIRGLTAFYAESQILRAINLQVSSGGRVAVIGRNGAGKSTLLKSIMNAGPLTKGLIEFDGQSLAGKLPNVRTRLGISLVPEDRRIFPHLTVDENIVMARYATAPELSSIDPAVVLQAFPLLLPLRKRYGNQLSGGQQQMLAIARAIAARPRLLLLDEPTEGLAPVIVEQLAATLNENIAGREAGLLLCEQNLWFARRCTDRVYVIDVGAIVFEGTWADFDAHPEIKYRYLSV